MVPFWVPIIVRHLIFRVPKKRDHNFDNHPLLLLNGQRCPAEAETLPGGGEVGRAEHITDSCHHMSLV